MVVSAYVAVPADDESADAIGVQVGHGHSGTSNDETGWPHMSNPVMQFVRLRAGGDRAVAGDCQGAADRVRRVAANSARPVGLRGVGAARLVRERRGPRVARNEPSAQHPVFDLQPDRRSRHRGRAGVASATAEAAPTERMNSLGSCLAVTRLNLLPRGADSSHASARLQHASVLTPRRLRLLKSEYRAFDAGGVRAPTEQAARAGDEHRRAV